MQLLDSHAHLNFEAYTNDWQQQAQDCIENQTWVVNIGAQFATSQKAIAIAEHFERGMYATVGLHPTHVEGSSSNPEVFDINAYRHLATSSPKVVGVGETGIDYYHDENLAQKQAEVFSQHVALAQECDLAVVIHGRNSRDGRLNAYTHLESLVRELQVRRAVVHCFGGTIEEARKFLDLGLYLGFTGIVTFKNAQALREVVSYVPLDRMVIETDAPYLTPEPYRSQRNVPQYVKFVAEHIAAVKKSDIVTIAEQTRRNALALFQIK